MACEPRYATPRSLERKSFGVAATRVASALGVELLDWQKRVLEVSLEVDSDTGRLAYREVVLTTPRQSGKSTLLLVLWVTWCLLWRDQRVTYTSQSRSDARKKWAQDWLPILERSPFGRSLAVTLQNGAETIAFPNNSLQGLVAATVTAGHGAVNDLVILDEAFSLVDSRLEMALQPSMITRPQPQYWVTSTAGTRDRSHYLLEKVERGRQAVEAGVTHGLAMFEWSAPEDSPVDDPATWAAAMPAYGVLASEDAVRASFASMDRTTFIRGFLNRFVDAGGEPAIPIVEWNELADPDAERPAQLVLAVDIAPGSKSAAIAAAGERDGLLFVSVLESGPATDWVLPRLEALVAELHPMEVVADAKSTAPLLADFRSCPVAETNGTDMAIACTFLVDLVKNRRLRHRGERELVVALDGAVKRSLGDSWAWNRKSSSVDISPLVAVTLAAWAFHGSSVR